MLKLVEMDDSVSVTQQAQVEAGPVVLINTFTVDLDEADLLLAAWAADAAIMKRQPGFISAQLHRGIGGSRIFVNYAVWASTAAFRAAVSQPEFRASVQKYPPSAVASPHLYSKVAVPGICGG